MAELSELEHGTVIQDNLGNKKRAVKVGDDVKGASGEELLTTDSAGRPAIRCNNMTGRGMSIIREDMLYTYDVVGHDDSW